MLNSEQDSICGPKMADPSSSELPEDIIASLSEPMGIYAERLYIFKKHKLKECILIVTRKQMLVAKIDASKLIVQPFDFMTKIDCVIKCLKSTKREMCQAFAIQLAGGELADAKQKRSHIILVHSRRQNFDQLLDFLNYQICLSGECHDPIVVHKKSQLEKFEIVEKNQRLLFQFQDIGFHRIENDERKLNMIRR